MSRLDALLRNSWVLLGGLTIACGAESKTGLTTAPETGAVHVTLATTGYDLDPDGYSVVVNGQAQGHVAAQVDTTLLGIPAGSGSLSLSGIAANCSPQPAFPLAIQVPANETVDVAVAIYCTATTGSIEITTSTTGALPDPDGYAVSVGAGAAFAMGSNDTHLFSGLAPGTYAIHITGIAPNCTQYLPDQVSATVGAGPQPLPITLPVNCPEVGTLRVETPIVPQVAYGFAIFIGDSVIALGVTDTTVIPNIPVGSQPFSIRIAQDGCVATPRQGSVSIVANQVTDLRIDCPAIGTLRVETPVVPGAGFDFAILVGNSWYALGASDTTVVTGLLADSYQYSVAVPASCTASPEQGNLTIAPYAATDLQISLTCPATLSAARAP